METSLWIAIHHHRHGQDYALVQCPVEPVTDDVTALFDGFEEERDDEWVEIYGPMITQVMAYDEDRKLLPRGHALKERF